MSAMPERAAYERLREDIARGMVAEVNVELAMEGDTFRYEPDWATADLVVSILMQKGYEVTHG